MSRRGRRRLRITFSVIFCLLFQQVAMAAYACTLPDMPPAAAMAEECADMDMEPAQELPQLCAGHCSPDHAVVTDASAPQVPPVALPPLLLGEFGMALRAQAGPVAEVAIERSDPPPRLRYCSLLI